MKRNKKSGFSPLEVIAAIVILAVVAAATVATVAPMRAKSENRLTQQEVATLNSMSQTYCQEKGHYPDNVAALSEAGFLAATTSEEKNRIQRIRRNYNYSAETGIFSKR